MRKLIAIAILAGALPASGALAQEADAPDAATTAPAESFALTPEQSAAYDSWPADQQAKYDAWPADTQGYYWSLTPPRQEVFWRLRDEDKLAVTAMGEEAREAAWTALEDRMLAAQPPTAAQTDSTEPTPAEQVAEPMPDESAAPTPDEAATDDAMEDEPR